MSKPLQTVGEHDEDDGIIHINTANAIKIHRSDNVKQDLVDIFNKTNITSVVEEAKNADSAKKKKVDDKGKILVARSDGLHHDLGAVLRSQSAIDISNSGKTRSLWQGFKPKISFTKNPSPVITDKRPSLTETKMTFHPSNVRIVHMSDTFNHLKPTTKRSFLPSGDILIHSGNFTVNGTDDEYALFDSWLASVKDLYHYRIILLGHRDVKRFGTEWSLMKDLLPNATHVLCNEEVTVLGIRFYGCPWHWGYNFNYTLKITAPASTATRVNDIPEGIDVLITHGPAFQRLDRTIENENWGSRELADCLKRVKPAVHLHGHVTEARGFLPAFGHFPLSVNSAMCERTRQVLYACPHVIKCTQILNPSDPSATGPNIPAWEFGIDSLT